MGGESGSADTARDPRGFAVKFYTEEGNWDLVGNNTPIFFIRDPILFPRCVSCVEYSWRERQTDRDAGKGGWFMVNVCMSGDSMASSM